MLGRFALEVLLFFGLTFVIFLFFERLLRSRLFSRLVKGVVPPPETDDEVLAAYNKADADAEKQSEEAENTAKSKLKSAAKLKGRRFEGPTFR